MKLVEVTQIKDKGNTDRLCFLTKNLYNFVNYKYRQVFFENRERANAGIKDRIKMPSAYNLMKQLASENQSDYRALPSAVSQKVIDGVQRSWKLFFKTSADYRKYPNKYNSRPNIPKYKHKEKGRYIAVFPKTAARIKDGYLYFAKKANIKPIKTNVDKSQFCEVRIVPSGSVYKIEIVYKKEVCDEKLDKSRVLSIDLGVENLVTIVDNTGENHPIVIKGGRIKALNQWYNKVRSHFQSLLPGRKKTSKRIKQLTLKRNNCINDALHKTSRFVVEYCRKHNIGKIVVGYNPGWKKAVCLGKKNNQKFVQIPFGKLIDQITYKAKLVDIDVSKQEESYTSKCDALACEEIKKHDSYLGRRIKRGMFVSSTGKEINADVNGALNILRKAIGDQNVVINWGCLAQPVSKLCFS